MAHCYRKQNYGCLGGSNGVFISRGTELFLFPVLRSSQYPITMALTNTVYNLLFRRTSTFAITIMVGAVFFERLFDQGGDTIFEQMNRGVCPSFGLYILGVSF